MVVRSHEEASVRNTEAVAVSGRACLRKVAAALGALSVAFFASTSRAQWIPYAERSRVAVEADVTPSTTQALTTWDVFAQIEVVRHVVLDLSVPWVIQFTSHEVQGNIANPTVGAHYVGKVSHGLALHVGGAIGIPTHFSGDPNGPAELPLASWEARGRYDSERWIPFLLPLRGFAGLEAHAAPVTYRGDVGAVIAFPIGDGPRPFPGRVPYYGNTVHGFLEQGNELEFGERFRGGLRFQQVFTGGDRPLQLALEPFFRYEARHGVGLFLRIGVLFGLLRGEQYAGIPEHVITPRLMIGVTW
jgi:hypothetical protein